MSESAASQLFEAIKQGRIQVRKKYVTNSSSIRDRYSVTVDDYVSHDGWAKRERLVCPEDYSISKETIAGSIANSEYEKLIGDEIGKIGVHAAYGGSVTPLHFDWDFSEIQHVCLYGQRHVWLRHPKPNHRLPVAGNSVLADFEEMAIDERERALVHFGAIRYTLTPGDYMQFPSYWWHLVDYAETSVAMSLRTEIDPLLRPLCVLPRSSSIQYLVEGLLETTDEKKVEIISALVEALLESSDADREPFRPHSHAIRQAERGLELEPMPSSPWIVSEINRELQLVSDQGSIGSREEQSNADDIDLCRAWLFGDWPASSPLASTTKSRLAAQMVSTLGRTM